MGTHPAAAELFRADPDGRTDVTKLNRFPRFLRSCLEPIGFLKFCDHV